MNQPTFIGIGPGRTGTSMLYEIMLEHPEICMARSAKETAFFNWEYERGWDWYLAEFENCDQAKARGEITTHYFYDEQVAARIRQHLPEVKLFTILRHPFQRMRSAYLYRLRAEQIPDQLTLEDALNFDTTLITHNNYAYWLQFYLDQFPREQLAILLYDDLVADPSAFLFQLLQFIDVRSDFVSKKLFENINQSAQARSPLLRLAANRTKVALRYLGFSTWVDFAKRSEIIRRIVLKPASSDAAVEDRLILSPEMISRLQETWEPQIHFVERCLGRNLDSWRDPSS